MSFEFLPWNTHTKKDVLKNVHAIKVQKTHLFLLFVNIVQNIFFCLLQQQNSKTHHLLMIRLVNVCRFLSIGFRSKILPNRCF